VASCSGSSLPGRMLSRLTPTDVGTLCAFLTGREKCGLALFLSCSRRLQRFLIMFLPQALFFFFTCHRSVNSQSQHYNSNILV